MGSVRSTLENLAGKFVIYPISFVTSIVVAAYLGPEDRGRYAAMVLIQSFVTPLVLHGFGAGIVYLVSSRRYMPSEILTTCILYGFLVAAISVSGIYSLWHIHALGQVAEGLSQGQVVLLLSSVLFSIPLFFQSRLLLGDSQYRAANALDILYGFLQPIFLVVFCYFLDFRLTGAAIALLLCTAISFVAGSWYSFFRYRPSLWPNVNFMKDCLSYGLKSWPADITTRANARLDQAILTFSASARDLGVYSIAVTLTELVWILPDAAGMVLFNRLAMMQSSADRVRLTELIHRVLILLVGLIAVVWGLVCYYFVIPYGYGAAFVESRPLMIIMIPGAIIYVSVKVMTKLFSGTGNVTLTSASVSFGAFISGILYFSLIPRFGATGAAIASTLGYTVTVLACLFVYHRNYAKLSPISLFFVRKGDVRLLRNLF